MAYFTLKDINSRGTPPPPELTKNATRTIKNLNIIQGELFKRNPAYQIKLHSTYRTPAVNSQVGGARNSRHMQAGAVDFSVLGMQPKDLHKFLYQLMKAGKVERGGIGQGSTYAHYDWRDDGQIKTWKYRGDNSSYTVPLSTLE